MTQRDAMQRLNTAGVSLKHKGLLPAAPDLEGLRAATTNFLRDSCPAAFGVEFDRISLTALVRDAEVRGGLETAEAALAAGDHAEALAKAALAFNLLLRLHEEQPRSSHPRKRSYSLRDAARVPFLSSHLHGLERGVGRDVSRATEELAKAISTMASRFTEALTVVAYGLDFDAYLLFKSNSPVILYFVSGNHKVEWTQIPPTDTDVVRRCIGFVVDAALRLDSRRTAAEEPSETEQVGDEPP